MDEKDQSSLSIKDILDQLIKPPILEREKDRLSSSAIKPSSMLPSQKPTQDIKLPSIGGGAESEPSVSKTENTSQISQDNTSQQLSQVRLSIRTMADDIKKLSKGQKPVGIETAKELDRNSEKSIIKPSQKTEPTETLEVPTPTLQIQRPPVPVRPQLPSFKPSQRSSPDPDLKIPKLKFNIPTLKESVPSPESEVRTPGGPAIMQVPSIESAPNLNKPKSSMFSEEKVEYRAIAKVISSGMTTGIIGTIVVAVGIYFLLVYVVFDQESDIIMITPTPTDIVKTPVAEVNELTTIFGNIPTIIFESSAQDINIIEFRSFISSQEINTGVFRKVVFRDYISKQVESSSFTESLDKMAINYPVELRNFTKDNNMWMLYGQGEMFDEDGRPIDSGTIASNKKIVLITEVKDKVSVMNIMKQWEPTMVNDLRVLFNIDPNEQASLEFLDNYHKEANVRYKNFPFPDKSIDYSIVTSLKGRHYLVMSGSRESMYSPLDKIRGF